MSDDKILLGHMYVAKKPCGRVAAAAWDDQGYSESTSKSVAEWETRGYAVERVAQYEGDAMPQMSCRSTEPCTCRDETTANWSNRKLTKPISAIRDQLLTLRTSLDTLLSDVEQLMASAAPKPSISDRVIDRIATHLDLASSEVTLTSSIAGDLQADSLDLVEIVMEIEDEFNIVVSDEEAEKCITVHDVINLVADRIGN